MRTNRRPTGEQWMKDVEDRLARLERPTVATVPHYAADPPHPREGQIWVNTTTLKLKVFRSGVTRSVTLS